MPTSKELDSIIDYGLSNPAINRTYFPNTPAWYFWSATTDANDPMAPDAWYVFFHGGNTGSNGKNSAYQVRLVR
jgi:hypothetical protein